MRAQHQVATHHHLRAQHRRLDAQRHPLDQQRAQNNSAASHCPTRFATADPASSSRGMPEPAVHQQRAQHGGHREPRHDVAQRPCRVLHAAHPAVARRRDQDRRHPEDRDPNPRQRLVGDLSTGGQRRDQRHREGLDHDDDQRAQAQRQPRGLHPFTDGRRAIARAEEPGRARGGAVGQERHLRTDRAPGSARRSPARPAPTRRAARRRRGRTADRSVRRPARPAREGQCGDAATGGRRDGQSPSGSAKALTRVSQGTQAPARRRRPTRSPSSRRPSVPAATERAGDRCQVIATSHASTPTSAPARSP